MVWSKFPIKIFGVHFGNSVLDNSNWDKISHSLTKKSHTYEEGGAHLRISFWHLLMNFEKPEKSEFWKNEKKLLEISSFYTCVPKTTIMWDTVPKMQSETELLSFWAIFCLFNSLHLNNSEKQSFEKMKKAFGDVIILNLCNKKTQSFDVCLLRYEGLAQT